MSISIGPITASSPYNGSGWAGFIQLPFKDGTIQRFDRIVGFANLAGLVAIADRSGNTLTMTRESPGPTQNLFGLTRLTEPAGRQLVLAYDCRARQPMRHRPA